MKSLTEAISEANRIHELQEWYEKPYSDFQELAIILSQHSAVEYLLVFLFSYLLGSIPFGLLLTRAAGLGDIRNTGSGNIGTTNVLRTGNKWLALATLLLDALKAFLAVYITVQIFGWREIRFPTMGPTIIPGVSPLIASATFAVLLGHTFPIWLKFKGGKGVACYFGSLIAFPIYGSLFLPVTLLSWILVFLLTRTSSLSALTTVAVIPFFINWAKGELFDTLFFVLLGCFIAYTHRENIKRLMRGEEKSFRRKKESP